MPSYPDSSSYQNQYGNQAAPAAATTLLGLEEVTPKATSGVESMIDKVSSTAKDLYNGVKGKADLIADKANGKVAAVTTSVDQKATAVASQAQTTVATVSDSVKAKADEILGATSVKISEEEVTTKAGEIMTNIKTKADEILGKIQIKEELPTEPVVDTASSAQVVTPVEQSATSIVTEVKQVASDAAAAATAVASDVKAKSEEVANSTVQAADAADKVVQKAKECDLGCFKECLELKNYAPYNVVEMCVTKKCSCDVQIKSKEALELISTIDLADLNMRKGVGFFGFIWRFSFICLLGVGLFFGMRKVLDYLDEKTFTKP